MRATARRIRSTGLVAALAVAVAGCASRPAAVRRPVDIPSRFSATGAAAVSTIVDDFERTRPDQAANVALEVTDSTHRMFEEHDLYRVAEGIKTNIRGGRTPGVPADGHRAHPTTTQLRPARLAR